MCCKKKPDDLMNQVLQAGRRIGMKKVETRSRKCCYMAIFLLSAVIYLSVGTAHYWRYHNASLINEEMSTVYTTVIPYDTCTASGYIADPDLAETRVAEIKADMEEYCGLTKVYWNVKLTPC